MDDTVTRVERAAAAVDPVLRAVTREQLTLPTPCHDWDLRALLEHLVGGQYRWAARLEGRDAGTPESALTAAGDDVAAAWSAARDTLLQTLRTPGILDREVAAPGGGTGSARFAAGILPIEIMLHGWDVARTINASTDLDPELAEELLQTGRRAMEGRPRGTAFADEQPAPEGATSADRLAAFYGRRV